MDVLNSSSQIFKGVNKGTRTLLETKCYSALIDALDQTFA